MPAVYRQVVFVREFPVKIRTTVSYTSCCQPCGLLAFLVRISLICLADSVNSLPDVVFEPWATSGAVFPTPKVALDGFCMGGEKRHVDQSWAVCVSQRTNGIFPHSQVVVVCACEREGEIYIFLVLPRNLLLYQTADQKKLR